MLPHPQVAPLLAGVVGDVDQRVLVLLAASCAALLVVVLRDAPRAALVLWLLVVAFVPVWLGVAVVSFFLPASLVGGLVLLTMLPFAPRALAPADWGVAVLMAACLLPVLVGGATPTSVFVVLTQWLLAFLLGRVVPARVGLAVVYQAVAVVFTVVSLGALAEFLLSWNPFVEITAANDLYATWGPLQERGGLLRAEGAFGHSIALGACLAMAIPLTLASAFRLRTRALMTAAMLSATLVTFSRVAMVCAVLAVVLSLLLLREELSRAVRAAVALGLAVAGVLLVPFVAATFSAAGDEATNSAAYRGDLTSLIPDISVLGYATSAYRTTAGELYFGRFHSIDSALILLGLTYGWLALAAALALLLAAVWLVVAGRASAPTIALVAQLPALATVALITQYAMVLWFVAGLAVTAQVERQARLLAGSRRSSPAVARRVGTARAPYPDAVPRSDR